MVKSRRDGYLSDFEFNLKEAGLPMDPSKIIGQFYKFDSHRHTLVGTVQAIELSDEGDVNLYVSNPLFWGERLISINYNKGKWAAYVAKKPLSDDEQERARFMTGEEYQDSIDERIASVFFEGNFRFL
ncbi:hypothetical protein KKH14_00370 [Patescibacteria group bacterium]|nr:hypothetical protein [Patescibacteria group bacterium]